MAFLEAAIQGWAIVLSWPNLLYPVVGTLLAMLAAFLPGLSGITLMAMALPLTLAWEPMPALLFFAALVAGGTFMGSVTAILFNVPGSSPNAATLIDGHPMARNGEARTAIACSAAASALGSTFGVFLLILLLPVVRGLLLSFGPAEFLMLTVWGLATVAMLGRGDWLKSLATAGHRAQPRHGRAATRRPRRLATRSASTICSTACPWLPCSSGCSRSPS